MQKKENRLSHVLLIYRKMIPSIRLCGHCQMEYLAQEGQLEYRAVQERRLKRSDLNWADVVLLGRLDNWYECRLTRNLKEAGKTLIYIIDDDLLNIPPEISSAAYYGQKEIQGYIREMIGMSDAILSPSPLLLEKYAVDGRKAIQIEEPAIDPVPYSPHAPDQPVKIGFAGSVDRTGDIEGILRDALLRIKREYGDQVQFEFFGAIPSFAGELGARCIPYCQSYDEYRETLNSLEWDIGLAPMPDTPFHACKHYNKFVEYAAAGVAGVFSDVAPYTRMQAIGVPAAYCRDTADEWYEAIRALVENRADRERARERCIGLTETRFAVRACCGELLECVQMQGAPLQEAEKKEIEGLTWLNICGFVHMVFEKQRTYGLKLPVVAGKKLIEWLKR